MEDKKTKRSDKRRKTSTENGKRFTKFGRKSLFLKIAVDQRTDIYSWQNECFCKPKRLLDKDVIKDVSLTGYTDKTHLNEVDGMTDLLYEKQGAYLQGKGDWILESAQLMVDAGILTPEKAAELFKVRKEDILSKKKSSNLAK